jgi:hypothetical protein
VEQRTQLTPHETLSAPVGESEDRLIVQDQFVELGKEVHLMGAHLTARGHLEDRVA